MKISIAMATYNGGQYLKAQLQSFVDQTRQPDELIITDDCSSDETETIVCEFANAVPFNVEFYRNEKNLGYCGNFNAALTRTTGDLVFLSDQDDVWFPEKIEHMASVAERNSEALVVMNDAVLTDGDLNEVGLTKIGQIRSAGMSLDGFVMGCCCAVRRELLNFCMPIPAGFNAHDSWLAWLADGLGAKVVNQEVLQYYRRHELNESQFIANRKTKVTRTHVFIDTVKNLLQQDAKKKARIQLEQLQIFADGVSEVYSKAPQCYWDKLQKLEKHVRKRIETTENRIAIRGKRILPRILAVSWLLLRGGYSNTSVVKAVLRDIVG